MLGPIIVSTTFIPSTMAILLPCSLGCLIAVYTSPHQALHSAHTILYAVGSHAVCGFIIHSSKRTFLHLLDLYRLTEAATRVKEQQQVSPESDNLDVGAESLAVQDEQLPRQGDVEREIEHLEKSEALAFTTTTYLFLFIFGLVVILVLDAHVLLQQFYRGKPQSVPQV